MKLLINVLGIALLSATALNVQAQKCAPMTKEAFGANFIEMMVESSRKACEIRFSDYKEKYEDLYPKWKLAASKHLEIYRCDTEKIPADLRKMTSDSEEEMKKTFHERILKGSEQDAKGLCDSSLQWLRARPEN